MPLELISAGILHGLFLAIVALGAMISFRILSFPDLTPEGSYSFGGAICAYLLLLGIHPILATLFSLVIAGFIGVGTALINLKLKVDSLLAGIIMGTMVYSINLRLMGKPNIALFDQYTLFANHNFIYQILIIILSLLIIIVPLFLFLNTEKGLCFRAIGLNPEFATRQGISIARYTIFGLFISNAICGFAGSMMVQLQAYADIGMGVGIVIHALAALMIGESIIGHSSLGKQILAPLFGAIIYQQIQGLALNIGLAPSDLKLLTGCIILIVIAARKKAT